MANHERSHMKHPLLLLSGLLCDETVWADIPQRLGDAAGVRLISFRALSSIPAPPAPVFARAPAPVPRAGPSLDGGGGAHGPPSGPPRRLRLPRRTTPV